MTILAKEVPEAARRNFLFNHLKMRSLAFESWVFTFAQNFSDQYSGGLWTFYELDNGGIYLAPAEQRTWDVLVATNGFTGKLSSDAFGVMVSLFALNFIVCETPTDDLIDKYYLLRDFACEHPENVAIMGAID